jgi:anti-anti-sigma factor
MPTSGTTVHPSGTTAYACRFERRGAVAIIHLHGEIDLFASRQLWPLIDDHVAGQGLVHLEVDLSDVTFLDAAGLRMLLTAKQLVERGHGALRVTGTSPFALRLFRVAGVRDQLLPRPPVPTTGPAGRQLVASAAEERVTG